MDAATLRTIQDVFASLHTPVRLLARSGQSLLPADGEAFYVPEYLPETGYVEQSGYLFAAIASSGHVLTVRRSAAASDTLLLARALVEALLQKNADTDSLDNALRMLLSKGLSPADVQALAAEHHLSMDMPRVVLLLHMVRTGPGQADDALRDLVPLDEHDLLVQFDRFTATLIKNMSSCDDEELHEFANALHETLFSESAFRVTIGVSEPVATLTQLHTAFLHAQQAVDVGLLFREGENVHFYSQLMLERFLAAIPPETAAHYHRLLFNADTAPLFTDEMLDTINMFLDKDLNLSDTARQLYIHRNTLVYRLDKVQRTIGLDLRHFDDAMTFKMLYHMKKCLRGQTPPTVEGNN